MLHTHLNHFSIGDKLKIIRINDERLYNRLLGFGIYTGSVIELKDVAPLGDPFIIANNLTEIAIRKSDILYLECELWRK